MRWPKVKLELLAADVPYAFVGGPFGSKLTRRDYVRGGIPVIRGSNFKGGRYLNMTGFAFVSETKMRRDLAGNLAREDDLVFTQRGTLGQVAMIPKSGISPLYVISQSQMKLTIDENKADRDFVYYYCSSPEAVRRIKSLASSSGVPHINLSILRKFEIPLPPLEKQKRIASILSKYDYLIANNRRRIALLDRAVREIYREWFVRLRFPSHEHAKIDNGVPKGWTRTTLGDLSWLMYGKALRAEDRIEGEYPVYGSSGVVGSHHRAQVKGPGIIVGRKGNIGSVYWSNGDFCAIDTVYFLEPSTVIHYIYHALRNVDFINTDVAVPGLNRKFAHSREFLWPSDQVRNAFDDIAKPMHNQIHLLGKENERLSQARDLLLPRVMDGRVAV